MNPRLLELLACPACASADLALRSLGPATDNAIDAGVIRCGSCTAVYPVVAGIPRLIPGALAEFPEFRRRYPELRRELRGGTLDRRLRPTWRSYSMWWQAVQRDLSYKLDNQAVWRARTGLEPAFLEGKVVLDAGCGNGRLSKVLVESGADDVVAMDLGAGVELARAFIGTEPRVHYVQGSVLDPPFRRDVFDYAMSIGVLHHTPDPAAGFRRLSGIVKPDGALSVYLYKRDAVRWNDSESRQGLLMLGNALYYEPLRAGISRLPHRAVLAWSRLLWQKRRMLEALRRSELPGIPTIAQAVDFVTPRDVYKPLESAEFNIVRNYDRYSTRYNYRHTLEELLDWFLSAGFADVIVTPYRLGATGFRPRTQREYLQVRLYERGSIEEIEARGVERKPPSPAGAGKERRIGSTTDT